MSVRDDIDIDPGSTDADDLVAFFDEAEEEKS